MMWPGVMCGHLYRCLGYTREGMCEDYTRRKAKGQSIETIAAELKERALLVCPDKWHAIEEKREQWD